jgi:hypothetical protein
MRAHGQAKLGFYLLFHGQAAFQGADPEDEPVTSVLPTPTPARNAPNGLGLASRNAMPQQSGRV